MKIVIVCLLLVCSAMADEEEDVKMPDLDRARDDIEEKLEETAEKVGDFFKGAADTAADTVKQGGDFGFGILKSFGSGIADRFNDAKDRVSEAGGKIKSTMENTASNVKDQVESGADKVSGHAKSAMDSLRSLVD